MCIGPVEGVLVVAGDGFKTRPAQPRSERAADLAVTDEAEPELLAIRHDVLLVSFCDRVSAAGRDSAIVLALGRHPVDPQKRVAVRHRDLARVELVPRIE